VLDPDGRSLTRPPAGYRSSKWAAVARPGFLSHFNDRLVTDLCGLKAPLTERKPDDDLCSLLPIGMDRRSSSATTASNASIRRAAALGSKAPPSNIRLIGITGLQPGSAPRSGAIVERLSFAASAACSTRTGARLIRHIDA